MKFSTVLAPLGGRALMAALAVAGCGVGEIQASDPDAEGVVPGTTDDDDTESDGAESEVPDDEATNPCALGAPEVYSPFAGPGGYPSGSVDELPWSGVAPDGAALAYPAGDEDFSGYGDALPEVVECSDDKGRRDHLDVTSGCLDAVALGSYTRGLTRTNEHDFFRALSLGYAPGEPDHPIKWTDQGIEYRFNHGGQTADSGYPGFKAFARYRSEDDLYVASWRFDGVVQIQRKLCGEYTALAVVDDFGPPSPDVWHSLRFEAVGEELNLYLDDDLVLSATSGSLSWGTAGIRIDSADGTYIDDWSVYQP
jgi:hypothetical protein